MNRNILYILGALLLLIVFYVGRRSNDQEPTMRAFKNAQERKLDSIRAQAKIQENIIRNQTSIIRESERRERADSIKIAGLTERTKQAERQNTVQRAELLKTLQNASDAELAETMTGDYLEEMKKAGDGLISRRPDSMSTVRFVDSQDIKLTGNVQISTQVAVWHIYERRHKDFLLTQNATLDSLLVLWEAQGAEWEIQKGAWKAKEVAKDSLIMGKNAEILEFQQGQKFMEGESRKFRRQRNGVIIISGVTIGGIVYFLIR